MSKAIKVKIAVLSGVLLAAGGMGPVAFADSHLDGARDQFRAIRTEVREQRDALREELREKEENFISDVREQRDVLKEELSGVDSDERNARLESFRENVRVERDALRAEIREKREAFREEARERVEALRRHVSEERAKRIEEFFERMISRFEAALDRLRALADRIEARLDKFEDLGKDISEFRVMLEGARAQIAKAEGALEDAKVAFGEMAFGDNPREDFQAVKELVRSVAAELKEAHAALVDVINSIKGASGRLLAEDEEESDDEEGGDEEGEEESEEENGGEE